MNQFRKIKFIEMIYLSPVFAINYSLKDVNREKRLDVAKQIYVNENLF